MATVDLKQLIINQINDLDPTIDTSVGSNVRDLLINPISTLLSNYQNEHDRILSNLSLTDVSGMSEAELDAVGKNFLVERKSGAYHTGTIKIYFSAAIPFSIPANTRFIHQASGAEFETTSSYTITRASMLTNLEQNGFYATGDIPVRSVERTNANSLSQGAVLSTQSITSPQPARIQATSDIVGGALRENNQAYYRRIQNSVLTSTLASAEILEQEVKSESNAISFVDVVGAGSPYMKRDRVSYDELTSNTVQDFQFVQSGLGTDSKFKQHQAFIDNFKVEVVASGQSADIAWPPSPENWVTEFTNEQYKGLFDLEDGLKATQDQYQIISISGWDENVYAQWNKNDGSRTDNLLLIPTEVRLSGNNVVLGKTPEPQNSNPETRLTIQEVNSLKSSLQVARDNNNVELINEILEELEKATLPENYADMAPILHKNIFQHTGVDIDVTMSTTDSTENGEMCYITVLRNDTLFMAHDGYGLAWRKQPEFLIRLNSDSYEGNDALKQADIDKFKDYFGVDPEAENLIGNNTLRDGEGNDEYWLYNMYMVDNNALDEEIIIGTNKVFDATNGINQYLQRGKFWIENETDYDFKIEISNNLGTVISVRESADANFTEVMNKGATYPSYVPNAGTKITTGNSLVDTLDSTRGHFGIGVGQTKSHEWAVKSTFIRSNIQTFPMHLFKFKIDYDKWPAGASDNFSVDYWGVGYDPDKYSSDGNIGNSRTQAAIYKPGTQEWELLGTHTATIASSTGNKKITKELSQLSQYTDANDFLYVAASAANFGSGFEDNTDHNLVTYYVQLSNPDASTLSLGNAIDVYCHAPTELKEKAAVYTADANGVVDVEESYISDIVEVREAISNISIDPSEYDIYNIDAGESFGPDSKVRITLDPSYSGSQLRIIYRGWEGGQKINAFLNAPENRYPAVTVKEKVSPPTIVTINSLSYSGDVTEELAKQSIVNYINGIEDKVLEKSDLIKVLSDLGATFVSLSMDIDLKQYDTVFNYNTVNMTNDRYTIPDNTIGHFYTNTNLVGGISKV